MCKEIENELKSGDDIARQMVEHIKRMGADGTERRIDIDENEWWILKLYREGSCADTKQDCPNCGSTIVDGKCSDVGDNYCGYTDN